VKVHVHRAGLLTPSLASSTSFSVIRLGDPETLLGPGALGEAKWKENLLYAWKIGRNDGRGHVIGESIPFEVTFVPLDKVFIHQIICTLKRECR
jgi:hypothetical protein